MKTTPYDTGDGYFLYSRWRTSKVTYLNENLNKNARKMSKNVELVTNCILSKKKYDSENFQVSTNFRDLVRILKLRLPHIEFLDMAPVTTNAT